MTNTNEIEAVANAIIESREDFRSNDDIAKAAIAASNSKYVPQLVAFIESLTDAAGQYKYLDGKSVVSHARAVLSRLPEELKQ